MLYISRSHLLAILCTGLVLATGCGKDQDVTTPEPEPEKPFPVTVDSLLTLFRTAHEEMDISTYSEFLHDGFKFFLKEEDVLGMGLSFDHLDHDADITCMTHIFSGEHYLRQDGNTVAGVSEVYFRPLDQHSPWAPSEHPDFLGTQVALFEVDLGFHRPGDTTIVITGVAEFYVTSRDSLYHGESVQFWQIRGVVDRTDSNGKVVGGISWGGFKVLYY